MVGKKPFVDKLQRVFDEGLYDPANEPDIAYAHLFSYFKGEEWRTQKELHLLLEKYFKNAPDGIPGNDDTWSHVCLGYLQYDGLLSGLSRKTGLYAV